MDEPTSMFNVEDAAKVLELTKRITEKGHRHHLYLALFERGGADRRPHYRHPRRRGGPYIYK